jgi:hypothetical protein
MKMGPQAAVLVSFELLAGSPAIHHSHLTSARGCGRRLAATTSGCSMVTMIRVSGAS